MRKLGVAFVAFMMAATGGAVGQTAPAAPVAPPPEVVLMLIRTHVLAVGLAMRTGNYELLRTIGSESFRNKNSAEVLAVTFAGFGNWISICRRWRSAPRSSPRLRR